MKRKQIAIFLLVVASLFLTACATSESNKNVSSIKEDNKKRNEKLKVSISCEVGNVISFGTYEQDDDASNGAEEILWYVCDIQDGKALLVSSQLLDCKKYNNERVDIVWETCSLREWLNTDFYNKAFSEDEKSIINLSNVNNSKNIYENRNGGNDTQDNVFILSMEEIKQYLSNDLRYGYATDYALAEGCDTSSYYGNEGTKAENSSDWWVRTPGASNSGAIDIDYYGEFVTNGHVVDEDRGIRPAIWITLDMDMNESRDNASDLDTNKGIIDMLNGLIGEQWTDVSRFNGFGLPLRFSIKDSNKEDNSIYGDSIVDCGDYYILEGTLECLECIATEAVDVLGEGDTFKSVNGNEYTIVSRESYNDGNREAINLIDKDGKKYSISNLPSFLLDIYTATTYYVIFPEGDAEVIITRYENVKLRVDKKTQITYDSFLIQDSYYGVDGTFSSYVESEYWNEFWFKTFDVRIDENGNIIFFDIQNEMNRYFDGNVEVRIKKL